MSTKTLKVDKGTVSKIISIICYCRSVTILVGIQNWV